LPDLTFQKEYKYWPEIKAGPEINGGIWPLHSTKIHSLDSALNFFKILFVTKNPYPPKQ